MDEREFEARLTARLHDRFDHVEPSLRLGVRVADVRDGGRQLTGVRSNWTLAAVVALVAVIGLLLVLRPASTPTIGTSPSPSASLSPSPTGSLQPVGFPSEVAGLPVISVASAVERLQSGKLDGQAVAVGGYFDQIYPSCPYPGRYIGPFESWCRYVAFTETRASAQLCHSSGADGVSCSQPSGPNLAPYFVSETSGYSSTSQTAGAPDEPTALVLIGHAGDARQWQCTAATQAECKAAFVVDRVAWANGKDVPPAAPQTGDQRSGKAITPRMTLAQVAIAIGLGDDLLAGGAFKAGDIATVDPRWNLAGDDIVWLVRSLGPVTSSDASAGRPEVAWLVDDATGRVIDSHPLKLASDYQPARLWQMATAHGVDCCSGEIAAFYRVKASDGSVLYEGPVLGGSSGEQGSSTYGGGYGSGPLVLPAGGYTITAWLATDSGGKMGTPRDQCSSQITLRPLDDVALNADFPPNHACTFRPAPSTSPGS